MGRQDSRACRLIMQLAMCWAIGGCTLHGRCRWGAAKAPGAFPIRRLEAAGEALTIEAEALGGVVTATELDDVGTELTQATPLPGAVLGWERAGGKGVTGGEAVGEEVGKGEAGLEAGGVLGELPREVQGGLFEEPIAVAAVLPLGEVLGADGFAGELGGHDGLDFRKGVKPGGEVFALVAVADPAVQLVAEVLGETGDFSSAGGIHAGLIGVDG